MADPKGTKPTQSSWPVNPPAAPSKPAQSRQPPPPPGDARNAGRIVHDARGNAVWDWIKDAGRMAIDSTSALLKRLEVPELKVEGDKDEELRLESDRDAGGGFDPYNQKTPVPKIKPKMPGKK
jgi:hypothetical protein